MKKVLNVIQWFFGVTFVIAAIGNGFHFSSLFILIAAFLMMPISKIRSMFLKINIGKFAITQRLIIILASIMFVVGILFAPVTETPDNNDPSTDYSETDPNAEIPSMSENDEDSAEKDTGIKSEDNGGSDEVKDNNEKPSEKPSTDKPSLDNTINEPSVEDGEAIAVDPSTLPEYAGKPYVVVNSNLPSFNEEELTTIGYEKYSQLDSYGRCGVAIASCGKEIMPREDESRGSISSIKPIGWVQASYSGISGGYLWNRCHLIGWQLSAENANRQNLITGTRYMNINGMLPLENMVADYIKETDNHVALRVTPIFEGDNLVCSGVQMEAYSVEDDGEGICFNVYCYNVQPGIIIDYATGESTNSSDKNEIEAAPGKDQGSDQQTDGNENENNNEAEAKMVWIPKTGKKYHSDPNCSNMNNPSKVTIEEAEKRSYTPCKKCY